ncbi:DUF4147 domain-containing protein [Desulfovibrio sp. OttesenSCG-928-O18]|nr:DUF4147 domain-containing protein [Desulfovibrio sp. OttesenSCG-928-O18]
MDARTRFKNYDALVSHGNAKSRAAALDCLAAALDAADTYAGTHRVVRREGNILHVGERVYDLTQPFSIYVAGAGKGSYPIAKALDEILGDRITEGIMLAKGEADPLKHIQVMETSHPVPDERSLAGGAIVRRMAEKVKPGDLVFACMTGGCSALMAVPVPGITIEDKIALNKLLLRTGAHISDMNAVRKHVSLVKGGGLIKMFQPATVITLTQFTEPDFLPWPDTSYPDPSTFADAIEVMQNYDIWDEAPAAVKAHLQKGLTDSSLETPKSFEGWDTYILDTGNPRSACLAAVEKAKSLGYAGYVLSTRLEGESRDIGRALSGIAKEIQLYGRPFTAPCIIASAGETTVSVRNANPGRGGPNQELVLGFAEGAFRYKGMTMLSMDSEGTDGPTDIAGGIADGETMDRARALGKSVFATLKAHDSSPLLEALDDAVITGPTGTNVVNLRILVVEE